MKVSDGKEGRGEGSRGERRGLKVRTGERRR